MDNSDYDLELTSNRKVPKKGRRAALTQTPQTDNESALSTNVIDNILSSPVRSIDDFPARHKKAGGWANETIKPNKTKSNKNLIEQERFRNLEADDSDDDIPVIPNIEEIEDDVLSASINDTIPFSGNKLSAYKELDKELLQQGVFDTVSSLDGIDLSVLSRCLQQENEVTESDEPWTWDSLFTEVASSFTSLEEC